MHFIRKNRNSGMLNSENELIKKFKSNKRKEPVIWNYVNYLKKIIKRCCRAIDLNLYYA